MPQRTIAHNRQRELFADLSNMNGIVLTAKSGSMVSMNIHGSFELYDKHWHTEEHSRKETMLALKTDTPTPPTSEPAVHFHVDWDDVKWARIQPRRLKLINMDYEIVFCSEKNSSTRLFWFYLQEGLDTQLFRAKWGNNWINLLQESNYDLEISNIENIQMKNQFAPIY